MESWSHPAFRPSEGTTMSTVPRREAGLKEDTELLTRTSWVNAEIAYREIKKGKADGNTCALWLRYHLQKHLFSVGCFIQLHCGKVFFVGLLLLSLCCFGLKTGTLETNVEKLWVEEDGRLAKELEYTKKTIGEESGTTYEVIIQTPKKGLNILSVENMQVHLQAVLEATKIEVKLYDITWKFHDLCYTASFQTFENPVINNILYKVLPCVIISPLDCFWEGARVLGPENPLYSIDNNGFKWTNLNPKALVKNMKFVSDRDLKAILEIMNRAGISSGYLEKPCLNPADPECPFSAPNRLSKQLPDVGVELTNGCTGFAAKYMQWHEDLIVGGVQKNKTGYIVKAEALQSIVQLMGEKDMYDFYQDRTIVHNIDWTMDKAKEVLETWQRKFTKKVNMVMEGAHKNEIHTFSSTSLADIMKDFSNISVVRVALGYVVMVFYACLSLLRCNDAVNSQCGIGVVGVVLVGLSVAAGLGMCSVLGIKFNASTTQIIPFLALGLGVDDMFLIAHTYAENANNCNIPFMDQTGECLRRTGVSVMLTSVSNIMAFLAAAIIPIPALRAFSLQAAILVIFNLGSVLLIFPAVVSLDLVRREDKRIDVLCCFQSPTVNQVIELQPHARDLDRREHSPPLSPPPGYSPPHPSLNLPPLNSGPPPRYSSATAHQTVTRTNINGTHPVTSLAPGERLTPPPNSLPVPHSASSSRQCLAPEDGLSCKERCVQTQRECFSLSLSCLAKTHYGPFLQRTPVKVFIMVFFMVILTIGIWGTAQVKDGLDMTDIVPRGTSEYKFLEAQSKYFGFYSFYAVTKGDFDYARNQKLLYEYHKAFQRVSRIMKREDGSLPTFWLGLFRQWLLDLQKAFDHDVEMGYIHKDGWINNASDDGILAYRLLVQTGDVDKPIDRSQVFKIRLVDENGIIYPQAFYNYLSAWKSNDELAYDASSGDFYPEPKFWYHDPLSDHMDLKIQKSHAITYAQLPFFLTNLSNTQDMIDTVVKIRTICESFEKKGLPNYPRGVPFTFWEQYLHLRLYLILSILCILAVTFIVIAVLLMNPWIAFIIIVVLAMMVIELFGFMGLVGIKLSAVPAVILVIAVGIGVEFTVHICVCFLTSVGSRDKRMLMSLEHTFTPVIHGGISTLLGVIMLMGAEFDFIIKYFLNVLLVLVLLGLLNGLMLLPVLLSVLGPRGEIVPKDNGDKIAVPTPEPSPRPRERPVRSISRRVYPRMPSDISLTTITEEPTQYSSHEIIVQPEVVVETTTVPMAVQVNRGSRNNTPPASVSSTPPSKHVTRVKATATVKVEVHTPLPGAVQQEHSYKSKRRKLKELDSSDSDSSNKS